MPPLLVLSDDRIAHETRHWQEVAAAEASWSHAWRRRFLRLLLRCAVVYLAGGVMAWGSLALGHHETAQVALWGGLLLSNAGPLAFAYAFWMREQGLWQ